MRKLALVVLGIVAAIAISACGSYGYSSDYVGVCVDRHTGIRVADVQCQLPGYMWDYVDVNAYPSFIVPAFGARINTTHVHITHTVTRGTSVTKGIRSGKATNSPAVRSKLSNGSTNRFSGSKLGKSNNFSGRTGITRGGFGSRGGSSFFGRSSSSFGRSSSGFSSRSGRK